MNQDIPKKPVSFGIFISKLHKKWAIGALLFVFVGTGLDRLSVIILRNLTDSISARPIEINLVWMWAILYPVQYLTTAVIWRGSGFTGMQWFMGFRYSAYQSLYEYLSLHNKDYFDSRFAGSLANKISNAVDGTESLFEKTLWNFIPIGIGLFWYVIFAWLSDFRLGFIIAIWSIIFLSLNVFFAKKLQKYSYVFAKSLSTLKGSIVDSISNISLVHEYSYISGEREYIEKFVSKSRETGLRHWWISEWVLVTNGILITIFILFMVGASIYLFQHKLISIGVVIMVVAIVADLSHQFLFIGQEMRNAAGYYGEAKEGLEEILKEHVIVDSPGAIKLKILKGSISLESIDFEYENTKVFKDFSLEIPAGQKVGFIGRSGAGKTTFVSLLLRHFDVQKGEIKIDGQNIYNVTLDSLRHAIAFVPQDTSLFHRSIKENIRYSSPEATDLEIKQATKNAQADRFINELPKGYDTLVGERGIKLSGGQRQRIAIARAFLKNAPILVLDEATSSLDSESESIIQHSLEDLMKDRTVIAIAHRLSTVKKMDRIIIIDDGKIVEDGSPEDLLKKSDGLFKKMWNHQVKGFIFDE
ncbi:MAG: ABC transporter ATP-binding protein [Candidatus Levybacteria bacterium CG_4_10_14_0_8_um_filter_35_23]|nr:MAG: ABC transporter ATP-binding protein [Candidatus Levybacteria bacterium CG_4_10_14_0_8_um_filter_35_23]